MIQFEMMFLFSLFQKQLIDPALKGTLNVVKSCAKATSVKRVVLTSSLATVLYNGKPRTPEVVVDETWFSDPNILRENEVCAIVLSQQLLFVFLLLISYFCLLNISEMVCSWKDFGRGCCQKIFERTKH